MSWQRFLPAPGHRCGRASPTRDPSQRLTTGVREPASRDPSLVPRHGEPAPVGSLPSCWRTAAVEREDAVAPPLLTHNSDPPQTYLWVSSLPTPQAVSSKQPMADLSLGLLPKPHVLAPSPRLHREPMSQAGAPGLWHELSV